MKPKIWTIPVTWEVYSTVEVEAFTLAEAYRYRVRRKTPCFSNGDIRRD